MISRMKTIKALQLLNIISKMKTHKIINMFCNNMKIKDSCKIKKMIDMNLIHHQR